MRFEKRASRIRLSTPSRRCAEALREHPVAPILDLVLRDNAFEEERVSCSEGFGGRAGAEEGHVAAAGIGEGADADDLAARDELIQKALWRGYTAMISSRLLPAVVPITANNIGSLSPLVCGVA